ncbi:MAG: hypothetical protein JXR62_06425 [Bacilli bacterium]|nr:hypothetical protein [Bacilli bacterium]
MKEKVIVKRDSMVLFNGGILDIPIKEKAIIEKSIEVFGDDDPCIIHQSYVIKELVMILINIFKKSNAKKIFVESYLSELSFLNFEDISTISIELVG